MKHLESSNFDNALIFTEMKDDGIMEFLNCRQKNDNYSLIALCSNETPSGDYYQADPPE